MYRNNAYVRDFLCIIVVVVQSRTVKNSYIIKKNIRTDDGQSVSTIKLQVNLVISDILIIM